MVKASDLGWILAGRREKLKMTQTYIASSMGVSERTVRNWETCVSMPNFIDGLRLCRLLKINPMDLINRR